jgi:hypothetical protein
LWLVGSSPPALRLNVVADADLYPEIPAVCYDEDLVRLRVVESQRQLQRLRRARTFPIPELTTFDRRHRYSRRDVIAYLNREQPIRLASRKAS